MSDRALAYARPIHPIYPLEFKYGTQTLSALEKVLSTLAEKDDWRKALWFGSVNSYLNNKMPKNLLKSRPQEILRVAEIEAAGVHHGWERVSRRFSRLCAALTVARCPGSS
jgi:hypothetical protein